LATATKTLFLATHSPYFFLKSTALMLRVGMQPRRSSVTGSNSTGSTICISLSISAEQQFFVKMIKSNQLKIITRDAGASGLHSNAEHQSR